MSEKNPRLHVDPIDIELIKETTIQGFGEWIIEKLGGRVQLPSSIADRLNEDDLAIELAPLLASKRHGDTLWLCRSRRFDVLYGNEGVCLVRKGVPVLYQRIIDY